MTSSFRDLFRRSKLPYKLQETPVHRADGFVPRHDGGVRAAAEYYYSSLRWRGITKARLLAGQLYIMQNKKEALTIEMASFYRVPVGHWMFIMWFEAYF